ncbi:MAG TPA: RdgB/HAM1 family non-canonical purine NTP pyrophosphatase [Saprospiraceae bacterium]|nr:RdgB/HAM1 family non-canonical purine NTP pyrophosphatase [Saprospiraceae bacterium]
MTNRTLVFATANEHKLSEIKNILPSYTILGLKDIGVYEDIVEDGATLEENALIKAKYLFEKTNSPSLSEDTGLEVDALDGQPGVHTARFAGEERDPVQNMQKLLQMLDGKKDRSAQFRTVISLVNGSEVLYFEGIVRGKIAEKMSGNEGFGYDPIFIPDGYEDTFADLDSSIKNTISHRARAVKKLVDYLNKSWNNSNYD